MTWKGVIIEESLDDKTILNSVKIENAKKYGMSIGILKEQMDIENLIDNP